MNKVLAIVAFACSALAACATTSNTPTVYPDFYLDRATQAVAVVQVSPGQYLPELEECTQPNVICLHSPFWFNAKVVDLIYGALPSERLKVSTLSHYGMDSYKKPKTPWLISMVISGSDVIMPLYASEELTRRKDGALFILITYPHEPSWLPCSVSKLQEPVARKDFPRSEIIPSDAYAVRTLPKYYNVSGAGAFPKQGINVERLREHLAHLKPSVQDMKCESESEQSQ